MKGRKSLSEELKKFCLKFGQQLRHISLNGYPIENEEVFKAMFANLPNVSSISDIRFHYLSSDLLMEKLVKLDAIVVINYTHFLSNVLFDKLFKLKYLSINFKCGADYRFEEKLSNNLKNLKNLKVLIIGAFTHTITEADIWIRTTESIAFNCRQLEYFSFNFHIHWDYQYIYEKQCFQSFANFSGLRKLSFKTNDKYMQPIRQYNLNEQITDLTPLKNCNNLFVLDLQLFVINRNIFNGIELIVPQLRQLFLKCENLEITDEVLESMAKLKYLSQIHIICKINKMSADGLRVLINGCEHLKHFAVNYWYTTDPISVAMIMVNNNLIQEEELAAEERGRKINEVIKRHSNIHFEFKRKEFYY